MILRRIWITRLFLKQSSTSDGIEFYGGDVNVKYGVFTNNLDDSVDWDEGYQGNLQYIIVKQSNAGGGEAFEMDTQGAAEPGVSTSCANLFMALFLMVDLFF